MKQYAVTIMNLTTKEETEIVINADIDEFPDTIGQMNYFRAWMKSLSE